MRRRGIGIVAALACATCTLGACNLITGASDLTIGGTAASDAAADRTSADGVAPSEGGSPVDGGGADVATSYACAGDACFDAGTCDGSPCPVRIVATQTGAIERIAANGAGVYWTVPAARRIDRLLSTSSGPTLLYASDGTPSSLATNGQSVFWTEPDKNRVRRIAANVPMNGTPDRTKNDQAGAFLVAVGPLGNFAAWTTADGVVHIAQDDLGPAFPAATGQQSIVGMGLTTSALYWGAAGTANAIRRVPLSGPTTVETIAAPVTPRALAAGDTRAAWITKGTVSASQDGNPVVAFAGENDPAGLAASGDYAYWTDQAGGLVRRGRMLGVGTGTAETLAAGQKQPRAIAVGGGKVYWVNDTGGEVWSLVLPP